MCIDVMRIGDLSARTEVQYTTREATAKAGKSYVHTSGTVIFEPDENEQEIRVPLVDNDVWDTTLEFLVELQTENLVNAVLGRYLWQSRIKIIDNDAFPSNKFRDQIFARNLDEVPKMSLMLEYFKLNWGNRVVRKGSIKVALVDQLHNMYFLIQLYLKVYLVDFILKLPVESLLIESYELSLLIYICVLLFPFALLHYLDYRKLFWKVGGASRATIQKALIRKFLNYDAVSRSELQQGDLILAMTRHSVALVHEGYISVFTLLRGSGQLFACLIFQFTAPAVFNLDQKFSPMSFLPLVIFPVLQICFLWVRRSATTRAQFKENVMQDALVNHVEMTVVNYRLIADYNRRPLFEQKMEDAIKAYNGAAKDAGAVLKNNEKFSDWLTVIFIALYSYVGGIAVIMDGAPLGIFLTNLSIIGTIGSSTGQIYKTLLAMQRMCPSMERVVKYMNLPTDVSHRKTLNRLRRSSTKVMRADLRKQCVNNVPIDQMCIKLERLDFNYQSADGSQSQSGLINHDALEIIQGTLVSFVGPHCEGKTTLLKILGGVVLPIPGVRSTGPGFFIPAHLRVLHVSPEVMFFHGTLKANMTFGVRPGDPDANDARIKAIFDTLGLDKSVHKHYDDEQELQWGEVLSNATRHLLSLARAFVANPEVLCVHKPTMPFDEVNSRKVFQVLLDFVRNKGLEQDPKNMHLRRPRTCLITSSKILGIKAADKIFYVAKSGIKELEAAEVTEEMLA